MSVFRWSDSGVIVIEQFYREKNLDRLTDEQGVVSLL